MESGLADSADGHFSGLDIVGPYADLDIALAVRDDRGHGAAFVSLAERNAVAFRGARIAASDAGEMACAGVLNMQGPGVAGDASAVFIDNGKGNERKILPVRTDHRTVSRRGKRCDECGGLVKPDVVLYEEGLDQNVINGAVNAIRNADCLIIGGTSLVVYPAAGLIDYFSGDKLVLVNKSATSRDRMADLLISGPIGEVFSCLRV